MSTEIINVLNYICEKLGIAIDWTVENAMPQAMDILGRYRLFSLVSIGIWVAIKLCLIIATIIVFVKALKAYVKVNATNENNFWWYKSGSYTWVTGIGVTLMMIFGAVGLISLVSFFMDISEMLRWIFVPEIKYLELLKSYVQ